MKRWFFDRYREIFSIKREIAMIGLSTNFNIVWQNLANKTFSKLKIKTTRMTHVFNYDNISLCSSVSTAIWNVFLFNEKSYSRTSLNVLSKFNNMRTIFSLWIYSKLTSTKPAFTCSKVTIKIPEQCVKTVQS